MVAHRENSVQARAIRKIRAGEVYESGKRMQNSQATGLARSFYTLAKMSASTPAITIPWLDAFCVGGFSFLLVPVFFVVGPEVFFEKILVLTIAINMPHFIASYRLLYQRREMIERYRWAAIYVPCALLAYAGGSLALVPVTVLPVYVLLVGSGVYLAWHYTGQAWGMMASFAYLAGRPFEASERILIRRGLVALLVFHAIAFLRFSQVTRVVFRELGLLKEFVSAITAIYPVISVAAFVFCLVGIEGMRRYVKRTGAWPPLRVVLPWLAIHLWYAAIAYDMRAIFWVQISHAVQYLIFPFRVEMNRRFEGQSPSRGRVAGHLLGYAAALVAVGALWNPFVPWLLTAPANSALGPQGGILLPAVMIAILNVHHYFADSCVWKISNPTVRRDLFLHIRS